MPLSRNQRVARAATQKNQEGISNQVQECGSVRVDEKYDQERP